MKLELIRSELEACEQALEAGNTQQALESACMTARLLMMRTAEWEPENIQKALIAMVGAAGAMESQLQALTAKQEPEKLAAKLRSRLKQVQEEVADSEKQYQQLVQANQQILAEEETLRSRRKKLGELQDQLKELTDIKEKQLEKLQQDTEEQKQKLEQLEKEYTTCEALYNTVRKELEENLQILAQMPDAAGSDTLDQLIEQGKQMRQTLNTAVEQSETPIRKIIQEVRRLNQMAGEKP